MIFDAKRSLEKNMTLGYLETMKILWQVQWAIGILLMKRILQRFVEAIRSFASTRCTAIVRIYEKKGILEESA